MTDLQSRSAGWYDVDDAVTTTTIRTRVLVIDDHALVADGLVHALDDAGLAAESCAPTSTADVLAAATRTRADVVLLDLMLEGCEVSALHLIGPLCRLGAEVVIFTGSNNRVLLGAAVEAGATGILHKSQSFQQLIEGVRGAARHDEMLCARERLELADELRRYRHERESALSSFGALTPREAAVLAGLLDGASADEIAERSFVSLATVRSQIRGILTKLDVNSQLAAVAAAHRAGWRLGDEDGR